MRKRSWSFLRTKKFWETCVVIMLFWAVAGAALWVKGCRWF